MGHAATASADAPTTAVTAVDVDVDAATAAGAGARSLSTTMGATARKTKVSLNVRVCVCRGVEYTVPSQYCESWEAWPKLPPSPSPPSSPSAPSSPSPPSSPSLVALLVHRHHLSSCGSVAMRRARALPLLVRSSCPSSSSSSPVLPLLCRLSPPLLRLLFYLPQQRVGLPGSHPDSLLLFPPLLEYRSPLLAVLVHELVPGPISGLLVRDFGPVRCVAFRVGVERLASGV